MKAVVIENFETGRLTINEVGDLLPPSKGNVTVNVKAAGLNRGDFLQARGKYPPPPGFMPDRPGLEFAGEITSLGEDVIDFNIGDRVMGLASGEAQAEFINIDHTHLVNIPHNLTYAEAAAIPEAFITAHDAIIAQAQLKAGESLLIHAVGSGVGLAALQIGKVFGATVAGTTRSSFKLEKCKELGLDHAINTKDGGFVDDLMSATDGNGVNVILDLVGASYLNENLRSLALKGRLMMVGLTGGRKAELDMGIVLQKRISLKGTVLRSRSVIEKTMAVRAFISDLMPLFEQELLKPNIDKVYPFDKVAEAYEHLATDKNFGKIILEW